MKFKDTKTSAQVCLRITNQQSKWLQHITKKTKLSISEVIRQIIENAMFKGEQNEKHTRNKRLSKIQDAEF